MGWWANRQRRRARERYVGELRDHLRRDYGQGPPYSTNQVRLSAERYGLPLEYCFFAYVLFCGRDAAEPALASIGEDYGQARQELADQHFGGNVAFDDADVAKAGSDSGGGADADGPVFHVGDGGGAGAGE